MIKSFFRITFYLVTNFITEWHTVMLALFFVILINKTLDFFRGRF